MGEGLVTDELIDSASPGGSNILNRLRIRLCLIVDVGNLVYFLNADPPRDEYASPSLPRSYW